MDGSGAVDRVGIGDRLEDSRRDVHVLLAATTPAQLRARSNGARRTNEQLLFHMVVGLLIVRRLLPLVRVVSRLPAPVGRGFARLVGSLITWSGEYDDRSYEDKGEVVTYDEPRELSVTDFSPLTGQEDVPDNYHTLVYTLTEESDHTQLRLSQDNCADEDEAEKFGENWQQLLDGIKAHIEGQPD